MRAARIASILLLASGAGGCLLFTDPVNTPPVVEIQGPGELYRGQEGMYSAEVTDSTGGARTFDWALEPGSSCPQDLVSAEGRRIRGPAIFKVYQLDPNPAVHCLWVIVADAEGARGLATKQVKILDRVLQLDGPPTVVSGQPVTFTADYKGEPSATKDSLFSWAMATALDATCEDAEVAARSIPGVVGQITYLYEKAQRVPFCVAVAAVDEFGIQRLAQLPVTAVRIAPPPAKIRPVARAATIAAESPLGIFTDVRLAAADEGELAPDEVLEFTWKVTRPDGTTLTPPPCPDARPAGSEVCFAPDRRGSYQVDLAVADQSQRSTAAPFALTVVDRAPCIRNSEPRFSSAPKFYELYDRDRVLKVSEVHDDGDPWPTPGRATQRAFRWSLRKLGPGAPRAFERRVSAIFDTFTIPAREYQPGDQIEVRFEYWDRLDLEDPQARDFTARCKPDDRLCELQPDSGCYQWITWTVEYL